MAVDPSTLRILHHPRPVLRRKAQPVEAVDDQVRAVAERMIELMHGAPGVGLAAPQVGLSWRMFVANPTGEAGDDQVFINPRFVSLSADTEASEEGCLSLPEVQVEVMRPRAATIAATGPDGAEFQRSAEGFAARVWQHEFDHLEGVLILDRMSRLDRLANRRAIADLEAAGR